MAQAILMDAGFLPWWPDAVMSTIRGWLIENAG
jgi:hypothetical protein